jgi:hypothetical protein
MTTIIIKNIYRTNLSQPGGLVRVLGVSPSDYNPDGKACYIEHVEPHPYGYEQGTRNWYEDKDLVTVCQYCGEDLAGTLCQHCGIADEPEDDTEGYNFLCDECGIAPWTKVSDRSNKALCNGCYAAEYYSPLYSEPDYLPDSDYGYELDLPDIDYYIDPALEVIDIVDLGIEISTEGFLVQKCLDIYADGHEEASQYYLEYTCWDGRIPF